MFLFYLQKSKSSNNKETIQWKNNYLERISIKNYLLLLSDFGLFPNSNSIRKMIFLHINHPDPFYCILSPSTLSSPPLIAAWKMSFGTNDRTMCASQTPGETKHWWGEDEYNVVLASCSPELFLAYIHSLSLPSSPLPLLRFTVRSSFSHFWRFSDALLER